MTDSPYCSYDAENSGFDVAHEGAGIEAKVHEELKNVSVHFRTGGTGIVLDDQNHVSTNAHVALNSRRLQVETPNGPLDAKIEKLDLMGDMAILRVPGLNQTGVRPAKFQLDHAAGQPGFSFGYPIITGSVPCIAQGRLENQIKFSELLSSRTLGLPLGDAYYYQTDFRDWQFATDHAGELLPKLEKRTAVPLSDRMLKEQGSGMSGGPLSDEKANVIGMNALVNGNSNQMLAVPARTLLHFAHQPSRFRFIYDETGHNLQQIEATNPGDSGEAEAANLMLERRANK